jgi:hypothetical protein
MKGANAALVVWAWVLFAAAVAAATESKTENEQQLVNYSGQTTIQSSSSLRSLLPFQRFRRGDSSMEHLQVNVNKQDDRCSICLDEMQNPCKIDDSLDKCKCAGGSCCIKPCTHVLCQECVDEWRKNHGDGGILTCPLCRANKRCNREEINSLLLDLLIFQFIFTFDIIKTFPKAMIILLFLSYWHLKR